MQRLAQPEPRHDVPRHRGRRGGGRRHDRRGAEPARRVREPEVLGPEVMPPLGHAVRLVDDEEADLRLPDALQEAGRGEPLRRDVEDPHAARRRPPSTARRLVAASCWALTSATRPGAIRSSASTWSCISETSGETTSVRSRPHQRRQLVTERLARAGGHHHQDVAAVARGDHRLALAAAGSRRSRTARCSAASGSDDAATGHARDAPVGLPQVQRRLRRRGRILEPGEGHRTGDHSRRSGRPSAPPQRSCRVTAKRGEREVPDAEVLVGHGGDVGRVRHRRSCPTRAGSPAPAR